MVKSDFKVFKWNAGAAWEIKLLAKNILSFKLFVNEKIKDRVIVRLLINLILVFV